MKYCLIILSMLICCNASAQSSRDSIAARFHDGGFITINYDKNGKPDIDTALLRQYEEERQRISDENRKNCSCNPFNIAKRMKEERERYNSLTPAQRDSIDNYYGSLPLFDLPVSPSDTIQKPLYNPDIWQRSSPAEKAVL